MNEMKQFLTQYGDVIHRALSYAARPTKRERILGCALSARRSYKLQRCYNYSDVGDFFDLKRASTTLADYDNEKMFLHFRSNWGLWKWREFAPDLTCRGIGVLAIDPDTGDLILHSEGLSSKRPPVYFYQIPPGL